jgi:uncharacterized protein
MYVAALWRYPVKSLQGEPLERAELTDDGVQGDRRVHCAAGRHLITGRTRPALLTVPASTSPEGVPLVAGHRWDSAEATEIARWATRADARFVEYAGPERFDVLNLLVATDGEVARLGEDVRRLRPNILLGDVEPEAERRWPGKTIAIGDALIGVYSVRERCVVPTIDPDTGAQNVEVLRRIHLEFDGETALNCWVIRPGTIAVGDSAELIDHQEYDARPRRVGGWVVGRPYALP